jgi:hypothetical protein
LASTNKGFHAQAGINPRRWLSFGGDYSVASGSEFLTTNLLPAALQAQINAAQAGYIALGLLPPNYHLAVPTDASTQTFAAGPNSPTAMTPGSRSSCVLPSAPCAPRS